jgi:hypothetical protein
MPRSHRVTGGRHRVDAGINAALPESWLDTQVLNEAAAA